MLINEVNEIEDNPLIIKREFTQLIHRLKRGYLDRKLRHLSQQIAKVEQEQNQELIKQLSDEFSKILNQLAEI
jgi:glutamyl-tRNA reductase